MTQNCLQIVDWLKSWFTPRDEDYQYEFTVSNHNPTIDSTVQITISVTDGNGAPVTNHSFILDANGTNVSLTTDQNGEATYNYTCSSWGICRFSIKTFVSYINIGNPYPVGSIYMSVTNTDPAVLFGGTWQRLEDTFLYATSGTADTGYQATGGSKDAVVVEHTHTQNTHHHGTGHSTYDKFLATNVNVALGQTKRTLPSTGSNYYYAYSTELGNIQEVDNTANTTATNQNTGVSPTDKNMPPYMKVYMWKRTA